MKAHQNIIIGTKWGCLINIYMYIWRFPEIGYPPNHPFIDRMFPYKPSIFGYPHWWKPYVGGWAFFAGEWFRGWSISSRPLLTFYGGWNPQPCHVKWWFPKMVVPQARWMVYFMENPIYKWMRTRGTPILGNLQMGLTENVVYHSLVQREICW